MFDRGAAAQAVDIGDISDISLEPYSGAAGGWASLRSVATHLIREDVPLSGSRLLWVQNKPKGFKCVSCAWAKPADHRPFEFCDNGAKATLWGATNHRVGQVASQVPFMFEESYSQSFRLHAKQPRI